MNDMNELGQYLDFASTNGRFLKFNVQFKALDAIGQTWSSDNGIVVTVSIA